MESSKSGFWAPVTSERANAQPRLKLTLCRGLEPLSWPLDAPASAWTTAGVPASPAMLASMRTRTKAILFTASPRSGGLQGDELPFLVGPGVGRPLDDAGSVGARGAGHVGTPSIVDIDEP